MKAFYGSRISDHLIETPEGYLVCKEVPIARTGNQQYRGMEFGGDEPEKLYTVTRPKEEVFSKAALASFEGKPVVDEHPKDNVGPENVGKYIKGTCRDVHEGEGEMAGYVLADLIIYDKDLISKIKNGKRDISCGYDCLWVPEGDDGYIQKEIRGNHVAVVDKGRAGHHVSIRDSEGRRREKMSKNTSLLGRMFAAFAKDSETTTEDLEAAAKLVPRDEEVKDEEPVEKAEPPKPTFDAAEFDQRLSRIEDTLAKLTASKAEEQEAPAPEPKPEIKETTDLDVLERELRGEEAKDDETEVEEDPEVINEQSGVKDEDDVITPESAKKTALETIEGVKPILNQLPAEERKKAADSMAFLIRGSIPEVGYQTLVRAQRNRAPAKDSLDDRELGRMIRDKYNPHYRKQ